MLTAYQPIGPCIPLGTSRKFDHDYCIVMFLSLMS